MHSAVKIAPPNSILFISDSSGGETPEITREGRRLWFSDTCIVVGVLMFQDGATEVTLCPADQVSFTGSPAFDGSIETRHRSVVISTVGGKTVLTASVPTRRTRIRIWTNREQEPDIVVIGWG